jgi:hypothetical protein
MAGSVRSLSFSLPGPMPGSFPGDDKDVHGKNASHANAATQPNHAAEGSHIQGKETGAPRTSTTQYLQRFSDHITSLIGSPADQPGNHKTTRHLKDLKDAWEKVKAKRIMYNHRRSYSMASVYGVLLPSSYSIPEQVAQQPLPLRYQLAAVLTSAVMPGASHNGLINYRAAQASQLARGPMSPASAPVEQKNSFSWSATALEVLRATFGMKSTDGAASAE